MIRDKTAYPGSDEYFFFSSGALSMFRVDMTLHTVSHVTLLVSSGKFMSGSAFFLSPPENKKAKFAFCTLKRKGGSTQKQPFLTVRFRGALLTKSVTLEFSQDTVCPPSMWRYTCSSGSGLEGAAGVGGCLEDQDG